MLKFKIRKMSKKKAVRIITLILILSISIFSAYRFYAAFVDSNSYNSSTVDTDIVYVNQLDEDKFYYLGLNYTNPSTTSLPTGVNQNLYSESNLVPVTITYSGVDINDSSLVGKVSPTEAQSQYIYYKYYPIVNNTITIELEDNLFSLRPLGMGFKGWATNYTTAILSFDKTTYTRYATIPVSNTNPIEITFNAIWGDANYQIGSYDRISEFSNYDMMKRQKIRIGTPAEMVPGVTYDFVFTPGYIYTERTSITTGNRAVTFNGYYNDNGNIYTNGNHSCPRRTTCTYYVNTNDEDYNPNKTYYYMEPSGNGFLLHLADSNYLSPIMGYEPIANGTNLTGYFFKKDIGTDDSSLYYDNTGVVCTESNRCTAGNTFKLLQKSDAEATYIGEHDDGTGNMVPGYDVESYYYLVTRDTNILVINANINMNNFGNKNVPFTVTASNQSANSTNTAIGRNYLNGGYQLVAGSELVIENITFNFSSRQADNYATIGNDSGFFANYHNIKIGRNVYNRSSATSRITEGVFGADNSYDETSSYKKFKVIIQSGVYRFVAGGGSRSKNYYLYENIIMGSDYDRANDDDNSKFRVYFTVLATFEGSIKSENLLKPNIDYVIKSGSFGVTSGDSYDANYDRGIYVGCRGHSTNYGFQRMKVEGGNINVINGGPGVDSSIRYNNVMQLSIVGGTIRDVFGGAGLSATYGNRIVQVTGGHILNNVFGGSNSYNGSASEGTLYGDTFLYFGGNADIGGGETLWNAAPGDVFGAGNGRSGDNYRELGTIASTHIVVEGDVRIRGNLYGGGNYGTTGRATSSNDSSTQIDLLGGNINGSVYGSSNSNGSGKKSTKVAGHVASIYYYKDYDRYDNGDTIPTTTSFTATVNGVPQTYTYENYHYNNSNVQPGDICNSNSPSWNASESKCYIAFQVIKPGDDIAKYNVCRTNCNDYFIQDLGSIKYVDGRWHLSHDTQINYGDEAHTITINQVDANITGNIYGGANSSGTVFANININLIGGSVGESVFAGGRGNGTYVSANIDVEIDGFDDDDVSVYGGSAYGTIGYTSEDTTNNVMRTVLINMNSGKVGTIYGGSMGSSSITPLVASVVTVNVNGGTVTNVYGGNNLKGEYRSSPTVNIMGGSITNVYGGSNQTGMDVPTVVNVKGGTTTNVFGGSNQSGETKLNYVNAISGTVTNVYGGNNEGGKAVSANVVLTGGNITYAYGCGKGSGTTCDSTKVWINNYSNASTSVFGGGERASVNKGTSVLIDGGTVAAIFGGSNNAGTVTKSNVYLSGGSVPNVFGGNNIGGQTDKTYVELGGASVTNLYGGGEAVFTRYTNVYTYKGTATNVFGGGHAAGATKTNVEIYGANITNVYGGSNENGIVAEANVSLKDKGTAAQKSILTNYIQPVNFGSGYKTNPKTVFTALEGKNVTWESSNTSVATVSGDVITVVGVGDAVVSTTYNGKTYNYFLDVTEPTDVDYTYVNNNIGEGSNNNGYYSEYQYKNLKVNVTTSNKDYNKWCNNNACMGYTYQEDITYSVTNPYNQDIVNYSLLLMGTGNFIAPMNVQNQSRIQLFQY